MKPDEMRLPNPNAADWQMVAIDLSYESDPPEIRAILPEEAWAAFARETFTFQATKASLYSQMFEARADMLKAKVEMLVKHRK